MTILPEQCRAARRLLNLSLLEVAKAAHVAHTTVANFEKGKSTPNHNNLQAIHKVLEDAGAELVPGFGVRLRKVKNIGVAGNTTISPAQCRAARGLLNLTQSGFAKMAEIGRSTVASFERGERMPNPDNLAAIQAALEAAGVEFIDPNGGGPGVRLREGWKPPS